MTTDELITREEIRDVLYRYCRAVDRGDRELLKSVYHADATDNHGTFRGSGMEFADHIVDAMDEVNHVGQHHITNILMEIEGDAAAVESYFLAFHPWFSSSAGGQHNFVGGRYLDVRAAPRPMRRPGEWITGAARKSRNDNAAQNHPGGRRRDFRKRFRLRNRKQSQRNSDLVHDPFSFGGDMLGQMYGSDPGRS